MDSEMKSHDCHVGLWIAQLLFFFKEAALRQARFHCARATRQVRSGLFVDLLAMRQIEGLGFSQAGTGLLRYQCEY